MKDRAIEKLFIFFFFFFPFFFFSFTIMKIMEWELTNVFFGDLACHLTVQLKRRKWRKNQG